MDIEERLEQAEKSETPSLVGSSIRSADDSSHNNYIHPEKYNSTKENSTNNKLNNYSSLSSAITASLDDLINEGALLGSEEDFDKFLEQDGSVKIDAIMEEDATHVEKHPKKDQENESNEKEEEEEEEEEPKVEKASKTVDDEPIEAETEASEASLGKSTPPETASNSAPVSSSGTTGSSSFYQQEDYSTPNLSEYQLEHDIKDHGDLLDHVQSYDLEKLPTSASGGNSRFRKDIELPISQSQQTLLSPAQQQRLEDGGQLSYLHTERARSRSRSANPSTRIREKSSSSVRHTTNLSKPHLARGDSYKSTHAEEPSKYELPGDLTPEVEAPAQPPALDERRSRQSKPTMGDSIAAAEALAKSDNPAFQAEQPLPRDPSLLTSGDYTNFEVDTPRKEDHMSDSYFSKRSESATNYLRSISRSRSRARNPVQDEKNDSNNNALQREGALVSDDPYDTIDKLDAMMEEVLGLKDTVKTSDSGKKQKEKSTTHEELIEEDIERAKKQSNEKDDANTDILEEEGALVNEDECTVIDKKDLEKEGISTEETAEEEQPLNIKRKEDKEDKEDEDNPKSVVVAENESEPTEEEEIVVKDVESEETDSKTPVKKDAVEAEKKEENVNEEDAKEDAKAVVEETLDEEPVSESKKDVLDDDLEKEVSEKADPEETEEVEDEPKTNSSKEPEDVVVEAKEVDEESASNDKGEPETEVVKEPETKEDKEPETKEVEQVQNEEIKEPEFEEVVESKSQDVEEPESKVSVEPKRKDVDESKSEETEEPKSKDIVEEPKAKEPAVAVADDDDLDDLDISPEEIRKHLEAQPIYIFTSLAGGMQIMPRTNRLATILQANGIKFEYRDLGTDEEAKKIWKRQANGKTLPGVVRGDDFIGNWHEIDEANEEYKLRELLYETL